MTKPGNRTEIRCKGYDAPPPNGRNPVSFPPGFVIGPVEEYVYDEVWGFATIRVGTLWINVWNASHGPNWGTNYAYVMPGTEWASN